MAQWVDRWTIQCVFVCHMCVLMFVSVSHSVVHILFTQGYSIWLFMGGAGLSFSLVFSLRQILPNPEEQTVLVLWQCEGVSVRQCEFDWCSPCSSIPIDLSSVQDDVNSPKQLLLKQAPKQWGRTALNRLNYPLLFWHLVWWQKMCMYWAEMRNNQTFRTDHLSFGANLRGPGGHVPSGSASCLVVIWVFLFWPSETKWNMKLMKYGFVWPRCWVIQFVTIID